MPSNPRNPMTTPCRKIPDKARRPQQHEGRGARPRDSELCRQLSWPAELVIIFQHTGAVLFGGCARPGSKVMTGDSRGEAILRRDWDFSPEAHQGSIGVLFIDGTFAAVRLRQWARNRVDQGCCIWPLLLEWLGVFSLFLEIARRTGCPRCSIDLVI